MYDELVKQCRDCMDSLCGECKYEHLQKPGNFVPCMNALLGEAADAIENLSKPRWIPVSERLPDGRYSVLALTGDCDIYVCDYIPSVKQFWTIPGDELHIDDITHWMPLPKEPEEE